jgi:DNA modification methylase
MAQRNNKTIYGALGRHAVHPFPARMAPEIICSLIRKSPRPIRILDPMMGSGTVVALARAYNHHAIGIDIDPLATLIARVWVSSVDQRIVMKESERLLSEAKVLFKDTKNIAAYPNGASKLTRKFIRYWFDDYARKQLWALSHLIHKIKDDPTRDIMWCAFSRLIISKNAGASLARDLAHSRPHKSYETAPSKPFTNFLLSVQHVLTNSLKKHARGNGPTAVVRKGDARNLPIRTGSIDLVLTSPPYLNAIDYIRCSKFSLVWMGHDVESLTVLRRDSVGTEVGRDLPEDKQIVRILKSLKIDALPKRKRAVIAAYIDDMRSAIKEVARVLAPGGKAMYVVGENTIGGTYIQNAKMLRSLARIAGLTFRSESSRPLPQNRRYMPPPKIANSDPFDSRMRSEVILCFGKPT